MRLDGSEAAQMGRLMALSQIGVEMAAPIGLGLLVDHWLDWFPWCTSAGAVLGLFGGLFHLVVLLRRFEERDRLVKQLQEEREASERGEGKE